MLRFCMLYEEQCTPQDADNFVRYVVSFMERSISFRESKVCFCPLFSPLGHIDCFAYSLKDSTSEYNRVVSRHEKFWVLFIEAEDTWDTLITARRKQIDGVPFYERQASGLRSLHARECTSILRVKSCSYETSRASHAT